MIGVLGGMGPLATVDFFRKVLWETPAKGDADQGPLLIWSDPRIAPRPVAILSGGRSPLPELLEGRDRLISAGAVALVMSYRFWLMLAQQLASLPHVLLLLPRFLILH